MIDRRNVLQLLAEKFVAEDPRAIQSLASAGSYFQYQDKPSSSASCKPMAALVQRIGRVE